MRLRYITRNSAQLSKYIFAGIVNLMVGVAAYYIADTFLGLAYWISNFVAISLGAICGYFLGRNFVFSPGGQSSFFSMGKYLVVMAIQYLLGTLLIGLFIRLGVTSMVGYLMSIPFVVIVSFLLQKFWVFNRAPDN